MARMQTRQGDAPARLAGGKRERTRAALIEAAKKEGRTAALLDRLGMPGAHDRLWQRGLPSPHVWYLTPRALCLGAVRRGLSPLGRPLRLKTVAVEGLWSRIRFVKGQSLALSLAAYAFSLATLPLARLFPADASASLFLRPS